MLLHKATHLIHLVLTASSPACFSPIATIYLVLATSSPVCFWYPLPVTVETSPCCRCLLTCFFRTAVAGGRSGRLVLAASSPICSSPTATVYGDRSVDLVLATAPPVCFWQPLPVIVVLILFSLPHGLFVYDSRCQCLWCWSCSRYHTACLFLTAVAGNVDLVLATTPPVCFWQPLPVIVVLILFSLPHRLFVSDSRCQWLWCWSCSRNHTACWFLTAVANDCDVDLVLTTTPPVCFWQPLPVIVMLILFSLRHRLFVSDSRCRWCWPCSRYFLRAVAGDVDLVLATTPPVCFWQPLPVIVVLILFSLPHRLFVSDSRCQWLWCWSCSRYHTACLFLTAVASDCGVDLVLVTTPPVCFWQLLPVIVMLILFSLPHHFFF